MLRSAQAERAVRPYCAQSDGWPSNAIRDSAGLRFMCHLEDPRFDVEVVR